MHGIKSCVWYIVEVMKNMKWILLFLPAHMSILPASLGLCSMDVSTLEVTSSEDLRAVSIG